MSTPPRGGPRRGAAPAAELPVLLFEDAGEWAAWLDAALCYGRIDGQLKADDDASWLGQFTPRGPRSAWSKINRGKAEGRAVGRAFGAERPGRRR